MLVYRHWCLLRGERLSTEQYWEIHRYTCIIIYYTCKLKQPRMLILSFSLSTSIANLSTCTELIIINGSVGKPGGPSQDSSSNVAEILSTSSVLPCYQCECTL